MNVIRYTSELRKDWNDFIRSAKNATFLFEREYMDYHADRFKDSSLLVYNQDKLIAVFPANADGKTLHSHQGLTYGGIVVKAEIKLKEYLQAAAAIFNYSANAFENIIIKSTPSFYHSFVAEEERFLFFILNAVNHRCDTAFVIDQNNKLPFQERRARSIKKAKSLNIRCALSDQWDEFWLKILGPNLIERFGVKPVHSLHEIKLLQSRFPDSIKLFTAELDNKLLAGAVCYVFPSAMHTQYISASSDGKQNGALDLLFAEMINYFSDKKYFSFGIANEEQGRVMNLGLMEWKEGFGARTFVHPFYNISVENLNLLNDYLKSMNA